MNPEQRWGVRCAGQALGVAIAAKNLVRVTAKELGGNLRHVLSDIEYAEVCAMLAFLSRHLEFGRGAEDEDDSESSSSRNRPRERRPPNPRTTPGKRRKVKRGTVKEHGVLCVVTESGV